MTEAEGIKVRELVERVYTKLTEWGRRFDFPTRAEAEIANDSDWHRTRVGYTGYNSFFLIREAEKERIIAFGKAFGSYPAEPFDCDIAVKRIDTNGKSEDEIVTEAFKALESNMYYKNSLMVAMKSGGIGIPDKKVLDLIESDIQKFIASPAVIDREHLSFSDLLPVVKSPALYKEEFIDFLVEKFRYVIFA